MLLLEQGVLCVLPMLWAALLFSEAGGDVGTCCLPAGAPEGEEEEETNKKTIGYKENLSLSLQSSGLFQKKKFCMSSLQV